jgi:hypothetical protein
MEVMGRVEDLQAQAEQSLGRMAESWVGTSFFGDVLARSAQTTFALGRLGADAADAWLATLRLAGRRDVARLAEQLGRTEDKLERVLMEIERLQADVARPAERAKPASRGRAKPAARNGSSARAKKQTKSSS